MYKAEAGLEHQLHRQLRTPDGWSSAKLVERHWPMPLMT